MEFIMKTFQVVFILMLFSSSYSFSSNQCMKSIREKSENKCLYRLYRSIPVYDSLFKERKVVFDLKGELENAETLKSILLYRTYR